MCIPTCWWGGYFETVTTFSVTIVVKVSLPVGGEVISRRSLAHLPLPVYHLYPYLLVGRLFRDNLPDLMVDALFVSLPVGGEVISRL